LAQAVAVGMGQLSLPIVTVPHPVGDRDEAVTEKKGEDIAEQCVRVFTTPAEELEREFRDKKYPLPQAVMPR
jgi:hypothetical protein